MQVVVVVVRMRAYGYRARRPHKEKEEKLCSNYFAHYNVIFVSLSTSVRGVPPFIYRARLTTTD